jgi:hypothetical protein
MTHFINKPVAITAVAFRKNHAVYPRSMEFDGTRYHFLDAGLSCVIRHGSRLTQVLTMTDGHRQFRLRSDNKGGLWTLVCITG